MAYRFMTGSSVQSDIVAEDDSDRDTKIDFEDDYIALVTGGSNVLIVSGSKVGIGEPEPKVNLDILKDLVM